jgi:hypothetical protein
MGCNMQAGAFFAGITIDLDFGTTALVLELVAELGGFPEVKIAEDLNDCFNQIGFTGAVLANKSRDWRLWIKNYLEIAKILIVPQFEGA